MRNRIHLDGEPLGRHGLLPTRTAIERQRDRSRRFLVGTTLALLGAAPVAPVWLFLIYEPRFTHAPLVGIAALTALAALALIGITQLMRCVIEKPFDLTTALAFGVVLIVLVVLMSSGVFIFAARM